MNKLVSGDSLPPPLVMGGGGGATVTRAGLSYCGVTGATVTGVTGLSYCGVIVELLVYHIVELLWSWFIILSYTGVIVELLVPMVLLSLELVYHIVELLVIPD